MADTTDSPSTPAAASEPGREGAASTTFLGGATTTAHAAPLFPRLEYGVPPGFPPFVRHRPPVFWTTPSAADPEPRPIVGGRFEDARTGALREHDPAGGGASASLGPPAVDVYVSTVSSPHAVRKSVDYLSLEELVARVAGQIVRRRRPRDGAGGAEGWEEARWDGVRGGLRIHSLCASDYSLTVVLCGTGTGEEFYAFTEGVLATEDETR